MDNLISLIEKKNYTQAVKIIEANNDIFKNISAAKRDNILETVDYFTYTTIVQGLLEETKPGPDIIIIFNKFLREFDYEQVRLRLKGFYDLVKKTINFFLESKIAIKIVRGLQIAINRITAAEDGLTPLHSLFVKLCIQTKTYKQAVPLLRKAVTCFNKNFDMSEEDITNYFYYGGHVMIALQQNEEAYLMFRFCLQLTHNYIYSSTLSAKKKLFLLVLRDPKLQYSPSEKKFKLHEPFAARYLDFARNIGAEDAEVLNMFTKPYSDLLYEEKLVENREEFEKHITENLELFEEDKNLGLVREVMYSFFLRKLKEMKKVYHSYPLLELSNILGVKEASIIPYLVRILAIRPIGRIDLEKKAFIFVKAKDNYRIESLHKLYSLTNLLKEVSHEYNKEHEAIIRDRISMPNTIFS